MRISTAGRLLSTGGLPALVAHIKARYRAKMSDRALAEVHMLSESGLSAQEKFSKIYDERLWVKAGLITGVSDSLSGHGSSLASTGTIRRGLEEFIRDQSIRLIFDAPCGDFHWMKHVEMPADCDYLGGDIVESVVRSGSTEWSRARSNEQGARNFRVFDITTDPMPRADVWMCKDCLQHLSFEDVWAALKNFGRSQIPRALITNHRITASNHDIPTGGFRFLDLRSEPFNLPIPTRELLDASIDDEPKVLALWTRQQVNSAVAQHNP